MRKVVSVMAFVMIFGFSSVVNADLIDRGGGMIYDDVLDITWLKNANYIQTSGYDDDRYVTWDVAKNWVSQLNFGGYNDWRLPYIRPINGEYFVFIAGVLMDQLIKDIT